jgi:hypothetical protein
MADRIKLTITEVKEVQLVGERGAQKLAFKAKSPDGKELEYFTFRTSLFDEIKKGAEIDAEVEVKTREYGDATFVNRQVSQIYKDGQPIGGRKQRPDYSYRDSPEARASIEAQSALKAAVEFCQGKTVEDVLKTAARFRDFLGNKPAEAKTEAKATPPKSPAPISKSKETGDNDDSVRVPEDIKNINDLYKACRDDWGLQPKEVLAELNYESKSEITDPAECYRRIAASRR